MGLIAMCVSLIGSWIPSLWGDEAASVLSALRPPESLLAMLGHIDAVHGAYYLGLQLWVDLFGADPFAVRFPSAVAVGVAAGAVTWICGRFDSLRFAVVAGFFSAILPRLTYAGEEARAYAFDAAIAALLVVVAVEIMRRPAPPRRWWAAYGAVLAVGIYTFLYLALMALVVGLALAVDRRNRSQLVRWLVASAAGVAAASPVIVLALLQRRQIAFLEHRDRVNPSAVLVKMWFGAVPFAIIAWTLIVLVVVGLVVRARRSRPVAGTLEALALLWLVVPMGILIAANPIAAIFTPRYGTFSAPAAAILMACGVRLLARRRWAAAVVLAATVVAAAPIWVGQREPWAKNRSDWNEIAATIDARARPGDAIVFDDSVRPSRRPRLALDTNPDPFHAVIDATLKTSYADSGSWHSSDYSVAEAASLGRFTDVDRVWVVEYMVGAEPNVYGIAELEALGYQQVDAVRLHSTAVLLFTRP
ncbi:mannosyltransferase [Microbacterium sp. BK668]|nr:mannosyltransferase [Microbacterium sp. BK668]